MALAAAPHPQGVRLVLKNSTRYWKASWDAAWTIPAPVIVGKQVTFTLAVGTIPVNTVATVNWGDGVTTTHNITGASLGVVHTYTTAGTYKVTITIGPSVKTTSVTVT